MQALTIDPAALLQTHQDTPPVLHTIEIEGMCIYTYIECIWMYVYKILRNKEDSSVVLHTIKI